jgi:DNA-binding Lrp family transcriptional regulator
MTANFVLIKTKPGQECEVYDKLKEVQEVIDFQQLFCDYDLIAKLEANDLDEVSSIITDKIRNIKGIIDTKTLLGIKW